MRQLKGSYFVAVMFVVVLSSMVMAGNDWENEDVIGINKEPAHCTLVPYADVQAALKGDRKASQFYKTLNGDWKFNWVDGMKILFLDFYKLG